MKNTSITTLLIAIALFTHSLSAQVNKEIELSPNGLILPKLDKNEKSMITPSQGQVLFNTTSNTLSYFDGADWGDLVDKTDILGATQLQLPHVSDQGDRLYLGNGKYVVVPGISATQPATIADNEGNTYGTFCYTFGIAGTRYCWMTENLRATKYQDGTPIPDGNGVTPILPGTELMFDYNPLYTPTYGKLYTHEVVRNTRNVCPVGYSVPNQQEWIDLINWLAGNTPSWAGKEAVALKGQFAGWSSTVGGQEVDFFGFNILPAGYMLSSGPSGQFLYSKFWSSSVGSGNNAYRAYFRHNQNTIDIDQEATAQGFSIRCVKVTP